MSTLAELQELIQEKFDVVVFALDPSASIRDSGLDSLAVAEFAFAIEDRFGVVLPESAVSVDSLVKLAAIIDRLRAALPTQPR